MQIMAVTRGERRLLLVDTGCEGEVPGFAVHAVDATGAGDAFMAGFIAGLLAEREMPRDPRRIDAICRFANAVGALTTTERGAIPSCRPGMPSRRVMRSAQR